ncbi:MAG: DUF507 family protein [Bradymonadaceae bacterium]
MRLYKGKIPEIRDDVYDELTSEGAIEVAPENEEEVKADIRAVLDEYYRVMNEEIVPEANDLKAEKDMSFNQAKKEIADRKGVGVDEEAVGYLIEQFIQTFFHSNFVEEIFALDREIRKALAPILREHMSVDEELDKEAREQIKNEEEGTQAWEVEYQKVMERLKRTKDLD